MVAAPSPEADIAAVTADHTPPAGPAEEPPALAVKRVRLGGRRLNRGLGASLVIVAGAMFAAAIGSGGLGAGNASHYGIPLDTAAHATPTPTHRPTAVPATPTPRVTLIPGPSYGPVGSESPPISPSGSPTPLKTAPPARDNTD
jgi:hypothetical protein